MSGDSTAAGNGNATGQAAAGDTRGTREGDRTHDRADLHAERPGVDKSTEAVEKVRLDTRTVTEDQTVSDEVRKEQVEVDDPNHRVSGRDKH